MMITARNEEKWKRIVCYLQTANWKFLLLQKLGAKQTDREPTDRQRYG